MRFLSFLFLTIACAAPTARPHDQESPIVLWTRTYHSGANTQSRDVRQTFDGGSVVAGFTQPPRTAGDIWLLRVDAAGDTLWTRTYGGSAYDDAASVLQTSDGGFIMVGTTASFGAGQFDAYLIRTDAAGDTLWTRTFGGTGADQFWDVGQTGNGGFILAGTTDSFGAGGGDVWLVRINAKGDTLWTRTYGGRGNDLGFAVAVCPDGGFVVTGFTDSDVNNTRDLLLIRTDIAGDTLWTRVYKRSGNDTGHDVHPMDDGGFIVAGVTGLYGVANGHDTWLLRTDTHGDTLWTRTYGGAGEDVCTSVWPMADGGFVLAGSTDSYGAAFMDIWLLRTDAAGNTLWTRTWGKGGHDTGQAVHQTVDGGFIVAGTSAPYSPEFDQVWLIRLGAE